MQSSKKDKTTLYPQQAYGSFIHLTLLHSQQP